MPGIEWIATCDNRDFVRSMNEMSSQIRQTKSVIEALGADASTAISKMDNMGQGFVNTLRQIGAVAGVSFSLAQAKSFVNKIAETRAYFQDIESSMKVFLGNEQKASAFTNKLKDYAYYNMSEFSDLANASKQMIAYGHSVDTIIPRLDQLSNVARGTNAPLMEMVGAYNRAKNLGGLGAKDLQSWAAKGLVIKDILKEMGEEAQGSTISFEQLNRVLDHVTGEGGMFHNLMGEQMSNISAEQGQLEDTLDAMYNELGEKYQDTIVNWYRMNTEIADNFVDSTSTIMDAAASGADFLIAHYKEIGSVMLRLIAVYGEWRATMIAVNAIKGAKQNFLKNEEIIQLNKAIEEEKKGYEELLDVKEKVKNADLAEAVAKKKLTEEQATLIAAKREELSQLKIDKESLEVDQRINEMKLQKLDIDLQDKVASEQLTLAQAQEVQQRRAVLESLENEITKRRELEIEKAKKTITGNEATIGTVSGAIERNKGLLNNYDNQLADIDKQIQYLEIQGGKEAEINNLRQQRSDIIEKQIKLGDIVASQEDRVKALNLENEAMENRILEIRMRYGTREERVQEINAAADALRAELPLVQQQAAEKQKEYEQMVRNRTEAEQKLTVLQAELEKVRAINRERAKNGEEVLDTAIEEKNVADQQAIVDALNSATQAKEENALATAAQEAAEKAQSIQEQISTLEEQANSVATGVNSKAKAGNTTATQALTISERIHNASLAASTVATRIFTVAVNQVKTAIKGLGAAIMTNPIGVLVGALTIGLPWLMDWVGGTEEAAESENKYGKAAREAEQDIKALVDVINNTASSSKAHKDAMSELERTYKEYGIKLDETIMKGDNEQAKVKEMTDKHAQLVNVLRQEAIERQKANDISDASKAYGEEYNNAKNSLLRNLPSDMSKAARGQLAALIDDTEIRKYIELQKELREAMASEKEAAEREHREVNYGNIISENGKKVKDLTDKYVRYASSLGLEGSALSETRKAVVDFMSALAEATEEQDKAKAAAIEAAEKAENLSDAQSENARRIRYAKMTTSELREELQRLPSKIPIDVNLTYNETNPMPEVLKNYTSKQWKARAAAFANMAVKHQNGAKIYDPKTKTTRFWSNQELKEEGIRASNQSDRVKSREDEAAAAAQRRKEEAEKNAEKNRRAAERAANDAAARRRKLAEIEQKEAEEREAQAQRTVDAIASARIAAEKNAGERERLEMENQHRLDLQAISDLEDDYRQKNLDIIKARWEANNTNKSISWTDSAAYKNYIANPESVKLSDDQQAEIDAKRAEAEAKYQQLVQQRYDAERQAMTAFLKDFGTAEEQRLAIVQEYNEKIEKAQTEGERLSLVGQKNQALNAHDLKQAEKAMNLEDIFNDLENLSLDKLTEARDDLRGMFDSKELGIDEYKTIAERIDKINEAIVEKRKQEKGLLGALIPDETTVTRLKREQAEAMERQRKASLQLRLAQQNVADRAADVENILNENGVQYKGEINKANADKILEAVAKLFSPSTPTYKKVIKGLDDLAEAEDKAKNATENKGEADKKLESSNVKLGEALKNVRQRVGEFAQSMQTINANIQALPDLMDSLGLGNTKAAEKVGQVASAANNAMGAAADFASGNYIGAAVKAIGAVKDIGRVFGIGGGNAAEINKQLARLSERNEILTQSIDKLTDAMNGKGGAGAIKEYMKVAEMQKELEANLKKQMQLQMSYHSSHGSFNKYWGSGFSASEIAEFNKRHGTNWSGNLNDLNADLAALLMGEADMWQKINDTGKGGYGERVAEKIKELAEQAGKAKEQTDALYASLTAGTTRENVFDDFLNSLYDLADGSEDVMENIEKNWQQMVNHMVVNNLVGEKLRERLSAWYDQLAKLNMERTKEGSTMSDAEYKAELERLQELYQSYVKDGTEEIEQFRDMGIIKPIEEAAEEAKKYFEDLRNSWASTLTDMTATADDWKQQLLSTVFSDLVESTILSAPFDAMIDGAQKHFDDFDAYLEDWKKRYKAIIEDTTLTDEQRNARLKALIDEQTTLRDDQAQRSKELAEGIGYEITESLSNSLDNLGDTILNSLLSVSDDAADMGKEIASTLIKEMLQTMLASEQYASQMDAIRKKWQQVLSGKNTDEAGNVLFTMDDVLQDIADLNNAIASDEGIKALAEQYHILNEEVGKADETLKGMSGDFKSSLMNLDGTAEDWAKTVGQKMAEKIIDEMVTASMLQPFLDELQKAFNAAMSVEGATIDGVLAQIAPQIDAAKQAFNEAQPTVQKILAALGITKKVETPFGDLRSTFLSTLTDMESDAETFGKEIGKTLISQMIDAQLKQQFQDKLDDLNSAWAVALQNGDTTAIATIRQQMVELRENAAQAVKPLLDDLKALEDIENPFADLRSSFLSSLQDLESDTKKFGTQMTENLVGQMMDEILSKNGLQEKIDELGVEWRKALDAGDTTAIDGIIAKMGALRDESAQAVEPLIEKLKSLDEVVLDTPLNNLRSSFLSDLMSMEDSTEDFADNINKILTEAFVDKFVLGKAFDEQLEKWEKRYAEIMEADINEADRAKQLQDLQQSIGVAREHYTEQARAIQELMGYTNTEALADQEAHVNMADKATYDQFELYLGIATAQQIALEQGNDVRRQILTTLQTMSGITSPNGDTVKEIRSMLRTTNEHLYAIKTATEGIRAEFMPRLQSIDNKLSKL